MLSLRVLVFVVVAAVSFIPVLIFGAWPFSKALDNAVAEVSERHLLLARNQGSALGRYHLDLKSTFSFLARNAMAGNQISHSGSLLDSLNFRHICIFNPQSGTLVRGLHTGSNDCPAQMPADRQEMFTALARENEVVFSDVKTARDGTPALFMVLRQNDLMAVGSITTDYFIDLARSIAFGENGHAAIVDRRGHVLAHPLDAWNRERKDISSVPAVQEMMKGRTGVTVFHSPAFNGDMIAGYTSVEGAGWGVMVPQPFAELEAEATSVRQHSMLIIVVGVVLSLVASWFLFRLITSPLGHFAQTIRRLRQGSSGERVRLNGRLKSRELGELEQAFNEMVEALELNAQTQQSLRLKAENADRLKSQFLANMSHEIRTPLNAIIGFSEVIKDETFGTVDPRYKDYSTDIHDSGQMMLKLINDILDLSKIEAGQADIEIEDMHVASSVARCVSLMRHLAGSGEVTLAIGDIPDDLTLMTDPCRFRQILLNLLSNAVKFTPPGGTVALAVGCLPDGGLSVDISDNGIGIDQSEMDLVFQPFGQAKNRRVRHQGTGLGLPLAIALCGLLGGSLELHSAPNKGTRARFILPGLKSASKAA